MYRERFVVLQTNWNLTVSFTALCKLGHKRGLLKKRKISYFGKMKNGQGFEINPSVLGNRSEKKFQTFAMWSAQVEHDLIKILPTSGLMPVPCHPKIGNLVLQNILLSVDFMLGLRLRLVNGHVTVSIYENYRWKTTYFSSKTSLIYILSLMYILL